MMRSIGSIAMLLVAGCSGSITDFSLPASSPLRGAGVSDPTQEAFQAYLPQEVLDLSPVGPLNIPANDLCEVAAVVLPSIGVDYSCASASRLSLVFGRQVTGENALAAFVAAVRLSGSRAEFRGPFLAITGGNGSAAVSDDPAFGDVDSTVSLGDLSALAVTPDQEKAVSSLSPAKVLRRLGPTDTALGDSGFASEAANSFGLDVELVTFGRSLYALGAPSDVELLASVAASDGGFTARLPVEDIGPEALSAIGDAYGVSVVSSSGGMPIVTGASQDVASAVRGIRSAAAPLRSVRIQADFLAYTERNSQSVSAAFGLTSGDVVIGADYARAIIDGLASSSVGSVIARPRVVTVTGKEARFVNGGSVPVRASVNDEGAETITYSDTGLILTATPRAVGALYSVDVALAFRSVVGGSELAPEFSERVVETSALVRPGDALVLSGLNLTDVSRGSSLGSILGLSTRRAFDHVAVVLTIAD